MCNRGIYFMVRYYPIHINIIIMLFIGVAFSSVCMQAHCLKMFKSVYLM